MVDISKHVRFAVAAALVGGIGGICVDCTRESRSKEKLNSLLSAEDRVFKDEVRAERQALFMRGLLVGVGLAAIYMLNITTPPCPATLIIIILGTTCLVYKVSPKKRWMLERLSSDPRVLSWLEVYRAMTQRHALGSLFGIAAYGVLVLLRHYLESVAQNGARYQHDPFHGVYGKPIIITNDLIQAV